MKRSKGVETTKVDDKLFAKIKPAIKAALAYESHARRKLGITGEIGEILVCYNLRLELVLHSRSMGFDAYENKGKRIEIKTRRSESDGMPAMAGRTGRFSKGQFDYALLGMLDRNYKLCEVYRAESNEVESILKKQKRRDISLSAFTRGKKPIWSSELQNGTN